MPNNKQKKIINHLCQNCGKRKSDVYLRVNPYQSEVNGSDIKEYLCNDCEDSLRDSI